MTLVCLQIPLEELDTELSRHFGFLQGSGVAQNLTQHWALSKAQGFGLEFLAGSAGCDFFQS